MISPDHGSASQCQTSVGMVVVVVIVVVMVGGEEYAFAGARDRDDGTAVCRGERFAGEGGLGCAEGDLAPVQAEHEIPCARLLNVVGGDEQAVALGGQIREQALEAVGADRVEPRERLVKQQQLGVL